MSYERRVCVVKQVKKGFSADGGALTGAVYAERLGGELTLTPRIPGLSPVRDGRYALYVWVGGNTYCLEMKGASAVSLPEVPPLKEGLAVLVCFIRDEAQPVAFGRCGNAPVSYRELLEVRAGERRKRAVPVPLPPNELPVPNAPNVPLAPAVPVPDLPEKENDPPQDGRAAARYDDEAIAESNYFSADDAHENTDGSGKQAQNGAAAPGDAGDLLLRPRGALTYYRSVREKLDEAFRRYPRDDALTGVFPQSEWVKTEGALLGVVREEGIPRYLCAAVRADVPPKEMQGRAVFVPQSHFSDAEGYWVVFQDADTGEYVQISED